ncbi:MAG: UbiA family prenyltransferase, partial [Myxococcales bacterium]|nr:UbiA family prenyltransferase [Myxococcales bacterium]
MSSSVVSDSLPVAERDEREVVTARSLSAIVRDVISLSKPRITGLNVLMTLGGLCLAGRPLAWQYTVLTLIGTALAVASANTLNMVWEREGDGTMRRTADRPL